MFAETDPGVRVRLGTDRATGRSRGFAFAEFSDDARAAEAIRRFDAYELRGRRLRVNDADDRPTARPPSRPSFSPAPEGFAPASFDDQGPPAFRRKGGSRRGLRRRKRSLAP